MSKVWFITGSSRGLGRALTEAVLEAGHEVVATARQPDQLGDLSKVYGKQLRQVRLDVKSPEEAQQAVAIALGSFGRIDVVVNNAGYGFTGAFEEMTPEEFKGQIDTNFWGVLHVTRAVLPILRYQGSGHIIQITSIGGRTAFPGFSGYHAAKYAVEGFSESVAQEIKPLGLKLTIVEPGGFRTDWAGASMAFAKPLDAYTPIVGYFKEYIKGHTGHQPGDPDKAASAIMELAEMPNPPLRLALGNDAMAVLRQAYSANADELERWSHITKSTDFDGSNQSDSDHPILEMRAALQS